MRHSRSLVLLPAFLAMASGCPDPADWKEPLGSVEGGRVEAELIGEWSCQEEGKATRLVLGIVPFDAHQYVILLTEASTKKRDGKAEKVFLRAFSTDVEAGQSVMNLRFLEDDPTTGKWTHARFLRREGQLQIDTVRPSALEGVPEDAESRRQAIGDLFLSPELWDAYYRCVPLKDEPPTK